MRSVLRAENRSRTTARYTHPATPAHTSSLTHVGFWRLTVNRCRSRLESGPAGLQADHRRERVAEERPPPLLANQPRAPMRAAGRAGLPQLEMRTCRTLDALPGDERRAHQSQQADAPHTATVLCRGAAEHIIGRPFNVRTGTACDPWSVAWRNGRVTSVNSPRHLTAPDILQDATSLVVAVGVKRFSIRELARRLGVQPAALYHYFPSKVAILQAVAAQTANRLIAAMFGSEAQGAEMHACTQVCTRIESFMTVASEEPNLWELLFLDARAANEGTQARLEIERRLTGPVAACRVTNQATTGSAAASARAILAITIGEVAGQVCRPGFGGPARSARQIVGLCLGAIAR